MNSKSRLTRILLSTAVAAFFVASPVAVKFDKAGFGLAVGVAFGRITDGAPSDPTQDPSTGVDGPSTTPPTDGLGSVPPDCSDG